MSRENLSAAIDLITTEILRTSAKVSLEECQPYRDPNASNTYIKDGKACVTQLRIIREELENIASGLKYSRGP